MLPLYNSNFILKTSQNLLRKFKFRTNYEGIRRCNSILCSITNISPSTPSSFYYRSKYSSCFGICKVTFSCIGMDSNSLTSEPKWKDLQDYYSKNKDKLVIPELFKEDRRRFDTFRYNILIFLYLKLTFQ